MLTGDVIKLLKWTHFNSLKLNQSRKAEKHIIQGRGHILSEKGKENRSSTQQRTQFVYKKVILLRQCLDEQYLDDEVNTFFNFMLWNPEWWTEQFKNALPKVFSMMNFWFHLPLIWWNKLLNFI